MKSTIIIILPEIQILFSFSVVFSVQAFGPKACWILHKSGALRYARNDAGSKCEVICFRISVLSLRSILIRVKIRE